MADDTVPDTAALRSTLQASDNPFAQWLGRARRGLTLHDLGAALADLNRQVMSTGKTGSLTLTIKVRQVTAGAAEYVEVADAFTVKPPAPDRDSTLLFVNDDDGAFRLRDPRQPELPDLTPEPQPELGSDND